MTLLNEFLMPKYMVEIGYDVTMLYTFCWLCIVQCVAIYVLAA